MTNNNDNSKTMAAEKTFTSHELAGEALIMAGKFCEDTECMQLIEGKCQCPQCAMYEFIDFCKEHQFSDTLPITELPRERVFDSTDNRYPSEEFLACLADMKQTPVETFFDPMLFWKWIGIIGDVWYWNDEAWHLDEEEATLTLHTYGWSGNESIIGALRHTMFWMLCFESSERGGHYTFDLSRLSFMKKEGEE